MEYKWTAWDLEWNEPVEEHFLTEEDAIAFCDKQNAGMDQEEADDFGFIPHKL